MSTIYQWKPKARVKIDPQVAGERLEKLQKRHGCVTRDVVIKDAEPPKAPLHAHFEWDDQIAAKEHRLEQANYLIRSLVVARIDDAEPAHPVRAFVSIVEADNRAYHSIASVLSEPEKRAQLLQRARTELTEWRQRYDDLQEFSQVFTAIDRVAAE